MLFLHCLENDESLKCYVEAVYESLYCKRGSLLALTWEREHLTMGSWILRTPRVLPMLHKGASSE